jgi:hypothetical protein
LALRAYLLNEIENSVPIRAVTEPAWTSDSTSGNLSLLDSPRNPSVTWSALFLPA